MVLFGVTEAMILKQETLQASLYKIQALGNLAGHWVMWNHSPDILREPRFLCIMLVVLLTILDSLPHVFPGKIKWQHMSLQPGAHSGDLLAEMNPGKYFLSHKPMSPKKKFCLNSFCCLFGLISTLQTFLRSFFGKLFIAC